MANTKESDSSSNYFQKKCPNFFSAVHINNYLRPNVILVGMNAIINKDISRFLGASPLTSLFSNKLTLSSLHPSGYRFGLFLTRNQENVDRDGTATVFVETDFNGHVCGQAHYEFSKNWQTKVWGQWAPSLSRANVTGLVGWANQGYNAQVAVRLNANADHVTGMLVLDQVVRLSEKWSAGSQVTFGPSDGRRCGGSLSKRPSSIFFDKTVVNCVGMLKWDDDESTTLIGTMNMSFDMVLRYQRHFNDNVSVGTELSFAGNTIKSTVVHMIELKDQLIIKGQIDTEGTVVGNIRKQILPDVTVGISTSLSHMSDSFGVGLEIFIGPSPYDGRSPNFNL